MAAPRGEKSTKRLWSPRGNDVLPRKDKSTMLARLELLMSQRDRGLDKGQLLDFCDTYGINLFALRRMDEQPLTYMLSDEEFAFWNDFDKRHDLSEYPYVKAALRRYQTLNSKKSKTFSSRFHFKRKSSANARQTKQESLSRFSNQGEYLKPQILQYLLRRYVLRQHCELADPVSRNSTENLRLLTERDQITETGDVHKTPSSSAEGRQSMKLQPTAAAQKANHDQNGGGSKFGGFLPTKLECEEPSSRQDLSGNAKFDEALDTESAYISSQEVYDVERAAQARAIGQHETGMRRGGKQRQINSNFSFDMQEKDELKRGPQARQSDGDDNTIPYHITSRPLQDSMTVLSRSTSIAANPKLPIAALDEHLKLEGEPAPSGSLPSSMPSPSTLGRRVFGRRVVKQPPVQWPQGVCVLQDEEYPATRDYDFFKLWIESVTDQRWSWWPLNPPLRQPKPTEVTPKWDCVSLLLS